MPVTRPFVLYLRSRLNIAVSSGAALLAVLALAFLRPHALLPVLAVVGAWAVVTGLLFFSRAGAREVVAESDEDAAARVKAKIGAAAAVREKISVLRLGDDAVARAVEYFLQESGRYLEEARARGSYSPVANDRIARVLDICQVFLSERDERATARRYEGGAAAGGADPAADPVVELAAEIRACAGIVRARITEDLLGTSGRERLEIMKELEEKK